MALKYMLDSLDGLAPEIARLYEKSESGFRLNVEGVVPREKLDEFRNNNIKLSNQLAEYKDIDPKKYKDLLQIEQRVQAKDLVEAGKIDEVVQARVKSMQTEFNAERETLISQLTQANQQLESLLIDSAIRVKAIELGVLPAAIDDVMLRAKSTFKIVEGKAVPHSEGKPIYGKDGVNPMGVDEWINNLSKSAPHLFGKRNGGGANGGSSQNMQGKIGSMSSMQKISAGLTR